MSTETEPDIEIRSVVKSKGGRRVVDGVDLTIHRGEFFSLLGPSGCGKTSLLRMLAGFDEPDEGSIRIAGRDMSGVPVHERDLNLVFQNYALFPHLSVGRNVAFGLERQGAPSVVEKTRDALASVRLPGYEHREPTTLSGGEQQRVALARAIVTGPRVLLLDEPLGALDLKLRRGLQEELRRLWRRLDMTFIYVTHDQEEALSLSDRIAVMRDGRVEQCGTPQEIYERPASRWVAGFVGTANILEEEGHALMIRPEDVRIGNEGEEASVDEILYQGASTRVITTMRRRSEGEGVRIVVDTAQTDGLVVGSKVRLSWSPEDARVLTR